MKHKTDNMVVVITCIGIVLLTVTFMYKSYQQRDFTINDEKPINFNKVPLVSNEQNNIDDKEEAIQVPSSNDVITGIVEILRAENKELISDGFNNMPKYMDKISLDVAQAVAIEKEVQGYFDTFVKLENNLYSASGWGVSEENSIDYVVFVDQAQNVVGVGVYGILREGLTEALKYNQNIDYSGWNGYFMPTSESQKIFAVGKIKNDSIYVTLGSIELK